MKSEITQTHKVSGATIHFTPDDPLPRPLVEKILAARVREQRDARSHITGKHQDMYDTRTNRH